MSEVKLMANEKHLYEFLQRINSPMYNMVAEAQRARNAEKDRAERNVGWCGMAMKEVPIEDVTPSCNGAKGCDTCRHYQDIRN